MQTTSPAPGAAFQLVLLLAFVIPAIFFLLTEQRTLQAVKQENRTMSPGLVWLQLIPLFGQLWQFIVVFKISRSIEKELTAWNNDSILGFSDAKAVESVGKKPTLFIGLAYCLLNDLGILFNLFSTGGNFGVSSTIVLAGMILWILYWIQLAGYKSKLRRRPA